eukprot:COSAG02_NODE_439_length_22308_cov_18.013508_7_plen_111_part_00
MLRRSTASEKINAMLHDADERDDTFSRIDGNRNGTLSLAEIDSFVKLEYPLVVHEQALIRAYKAARVSKDGVIERPEFFKCGLVCGCHSASVTRACCSRPRCLLPVGTGY